MLAIQYCVTVTNLAACSDLFIFTQRSWVLHSGPHGLLVKVPAGCTLIWGLDRGRTYLQVHVNSAHRFIFLWN